MTEPSTSSAQIFSGLVDDLAKSSHGSNELRAIKGFLEKNLKKTAARENFLLPLLTRSAVSWDEVKDIDSEVRGYFADFDEPCFIEHEKVHAATVYASMTVTGWHLLNGFIQERETRAINISEAILLRES